LRRAEFGQLPFGLTFKLSKRVGFHLNVPEESSMVFQILVNVKLNASNPFGLQSQSKQNIAPPKKKVAKQPFMSPALAVYE
jgi:hypothetical protein